MSGDYKYGMQLIAEDLAQERYNADFYALPDDIQCALYEEAMNQYVERSVS